MPSEQIQRLFNQVTEANSYILNRLYERKPVENIPSLAKQYERDFPATAIPHTFTVLQKALADAKIASPTQEELEALKGLAKDRAMSVLFSRTDQYDARDSQFERALDVVNKKLQTTLDQNPVLKVKLAEQKISSDLKKLQSDQVEDLKRFIEGAHNLNRQLFIEGRDIAKEKLLKSNWKLEGKETSSDEKSGPLLVLGQSENSTSKTGFWLDKESKDKLGRRKYKFGIRVTEENGKLTGRPVPPPNIYNKTSFKESYRQVFKQLGSDTITIDEPPADPNQNVGPDVVKNWVNWLIEVAKEEKLQINVDKHLQWLESRVEGGVLSSYSLQTYVNETRERVIKQNQEIMEAKRDSVGGAQSQMKTESEEYDAKREAERIAQQALFAQPLPQPQSQVQPGQQAAPGQQPQPQAQPVVQPTQQPASGQQPQPQAQPVPAQPIVQPVQQPAPVQQVQPVAQPIQQPTPIPQAQPVAAQPTKQPAPDQHPGPTKVADKYVLKEDKKEEQVIDEPVRRRFGA